MEKKEVLCSGKAQQPKLMLALQLCLPRKGTEGCRENRSTDTYLTNGYISLHELHRNLRKKTTIQDKWEQTTQFSAVAAHLNCKVESGIHFYTSSNMPFSSRGAHKTLTQGEVRFLMQKFSGREKTAFLLALFDWYCTDHTSIVSCWV